MLVEDWDAFAAQAQALYRADPLRFRYVLKYRRGRLEAKCTDDRACVRFRTDQQSALRQVEALNGAFFALMATGSYDAEAAAREQAQERAQQQQAQQQAQQQQQQRGGTRRRG
jgi:signal recognition particle subunit SRP9